MPFWLLLLLAVADPAAPVVRPNPPAKETLSYTIEWRLITAGKARMMWSPAGSGWETRLELDSTGLVSKLYSVDDDYTSRLDADLCAQSSHMTAHEGRRHRETSVTYDRQSRKASYLEKEIPKNNILNQQEIDIPGCVHDVVGGLYYLRTLHLEPGQSTQVPVSDGKKAVMARIEAQQREVLKTPAGTFKTVRYEAYLFNNVLYRRPAHLYVWLTDDERRVPVQIRVRMQFTIGTITLQLEKIDNS